MWANVRFGAIGDPEAEELVLTKVVEVSPEALAKARAEALELKARLEGESQA